MKLFSLSLLAAVLLAACSTSSEKPVDNKLYAHTWLLDSISEQVVPMDSLFPQKRPQLHFNESEKMVSGNDGCNGYSAPFTLEQSNLSFGEPGPSTLMYCGEGDLIFRNLMKEVRDFSIDQNEKLVLHTNDDLNMYFKKSGK